VHLVYQGPKLRVCDPTKAFPELDAKIRYQDGYPLLFISEESLESVQTSVRPLVGVQGIAQEWTEKKLEMERSVIAAVPISLYHMNLPLQI
jgi:uncharacterized protein